MVKCGNCGNFLTFRYQFTLVKCCDHCGYIVSSNTQVTFKCYPPPNEFSLDLIHKTITVQKTKGIVTGKLRYFYTEGYLNKWAVCLDKQHFWLCESLGHYFVLMGSQKETFNKKLGLGNKITVDDKAYFVDAIHTALGYSLEGELPDFDTYFSSFKSIECSNGADLLIIHQDNQGNQKFFKGVDISFNEIITTLH